MYYFDMGYGGNCCHFIATLIVYNTLRDTSKINFFESRSHRYIDKFKNLKKIQFVSKDRYNSELFQTKCSPSVEVYNRWAEKNRDFKYIYIYFTSAEDSRLSAFFHFHKVLRKYNEGSIKEYMDFYTSLPNAKPIKSLCDLSETESKMVFEHSLSTKPYLLEYNKLPVVPDEFKDNIHLINFRDILHDKEKIINLVEQITKKPVLPQLRENYDRYLELQFELIRQLENPK